MDTEYTHRARLYGVECYLNIFTNDFKGITFIHDIIICICVYLDEAFNLFETFPIEIIEEL